MMRIVAFAGIVAAALSSAVAQPLSVYGPVTDGAVVQRGAPFVVQGAAAPGERLTVTFGPRRAATRADGIGKWAVTMRSLPEGGPYELAVRGQSETFTAADIRVGDVWLCSGQSNMEFPVRRSLGDGAPTPDETQKIRLLTVAKAAPPAPLKYLPQGSGWVPATAEHVADFSAVCWFAARDFFAEENVPVGLIDASWGGSQIETWLPERALRSLGQFDERLDLLNLYANDPAAAMAALGARWEAWWQGAGDSSSPWQENGEEPGWRDVPAGEMRDWKGYGDATVERHLGKVWFAKTVSLTAAQARSATRLELGGIDEVDVTWVNGRFIGSTFGWGDQRQYDVPEGVLVEGENVIVTNIDNAYGQGGLLGPKADMGIVLSDGSRVPLGAGWRYRAVIDGKSGAPRGPWESISGLTTLYNGMLAPLGTTSLSGAIWYQGESNTGRGGAYGLLLASLVDSWRQQFGKNLPVVVVQLPGYGAQPTAPSPSGWSDVREAMRLVAKADPKVGLAVIMDAGDRTDIHPPNKVVVGQRVAESMRALMNNEGSADGINPVRVVREAGKVTVTMSDPSLQSISSARPIGFELCDAAGRCAFADAALAGGEISLSIPGDMTPVEVRFCWGDAPICNLFATDAVPVGPFSAAVVEAP